MITKMKKLSFLIYHREYESFLAELRKLGVVHVEEHQAGNMDESLQTLLKQRAQYSAVAKEMMLKAKTKASEAVHDGMSADDLVAQFEGQNEEITRISQQIPQVDKDLSDMKVWGQFDWQTVQNLEQAGWKMQFYNCTEREFNAEWEQQYDIVIINRNLGRVSFVLLTKESVRLDIEALKLPVCSLQQLQDKKQLLTVQLEEAKGKLADFCADNYKTMLARISALESDIELAKVRLDGEPQADGAVLLMEGWIPADCEKQVAEYLDQSSVYYELRDVCKGDNPPIKLKNNWFVKSYELLTSMYGMPSYTEFDPTPLIAPFFSLFFAFCLGDAGYGLVFILLGMLMKKKLPKMAGMMNLIILLGVFTLVFGSILGTFFGVNLYEATFVPEGLKNFMVSGKIPGTSYDKQMVLAIIIGVIHTIVAMLIKALVHTSRFGFKNSLGEWGWFLLVSALPILGSVMMFNLLPETVSTWAFIIVGGISAIGIYLFNDMSRNIFVNIGAGVWTTYNMASGLMGDILSYIRLYALGLAGGMLGGVFNQLGMMVQESAGGIPGWCLCCLILVLGHTLNIAMSTISAFVHPLRLNFVEYFKNSGYEGSGVLYKPFANDNTEK